MPALAIERWARSSDDAPDSPVVLTIEGPYGPIIHAVTDAAAKRGARAGARLTDARALDPALVAVAADPEGDAALVQRLATWAGRWSPLVEVDSDSLKLDVTGVAHLFGNEQALSHDMQRRFAGIGLTARIAIGPTSAAAWALAHQDPGICRDNVKERLAPLHVSALRVNANIVRTLERLGLKTIGALLDVPRLALVRRFRGAEDVVDALDRAIGRKPEPLTSAPIDLPPRALLKLEEPATYSEAAGQALEQLVPALVDQLQKRRLGTRRLSLIGYRVDGSVAIASVATAIPSREPCHLHRLLVEKTTSLDPEFGFDAFALIADRTEDLDAAQESLVAEPSDARELARLVDRLTVKLGPKRVRRPRHCESHLPERASGWEPAIHLHPPSGRGENRPQRLLDRPEAIDVIYATPEGMPRRFVWRRRVHDIARVEGPERIAPEWWRQSSSARLRDYYRVEDEAGCRYWIYREGLIGDGRGGVPSWFVHGLFG